MSPIENGGELLDGQNSILRIATDKFLNATTSEDRISAIVMLEDVKKPVELYRAGEMCLEAASSAKNLFKQANLLIRARGNFQALLDRSSLVAHKVGSRQIGALAMSALMPLYDSLILIDKVPQPEQASVTYRDVVGVLEDCWTAIYETERRATTARLIGVSQELTVLLLLQRFGIQKLRDSSWLAIPSYISEDISQSEDGHSTNDSWDISVFTATNAGYNPKLTYKVQVKSRNHYNDSDTRPYADDILVVNSSRHLELSHHARGLDYETVYEELIAEIKDPDNEQVRDVLDRRTDKLLDILG